MGRGEFFQAFLRTASKGRTGFVPRFGRGRPPSFSCDCENTRKGGLHQAVGAGAEEFEEAEGAADLELLADFVGEARYSTQLAASLTSLADTTLPIEQATFFACAAESTTVTA